MGKKISVFLFSILLLSFFPLSASAKIGIELRGGMALINPADYNTGLLYKSGLSNKGFSNAFANIYVGNGPAYNDLKLQPSEAIGSSLSQMFDGGLNVSIFLGDSFAIKLRGDGLYSEYDDIITIPDASGSPIECLYSHTILMTAYAGAGLAYYFNLSPNLAFYLSADGGMYLNLNSFYEAGSFTSASDLLNILKLPQGSYSVDFKDSFFGGHGEAGVQLLLSEGMGVSLFGGYRLGTMPITFPNGGKVTLVDANGDPVFTTVGRTSGATDTSVIFNSTSIDISGVYFGAGMVFYFGADKLPASGGTAAAAGATSKYEQYGNYYFKQKNYKSALSYYNGAYKQAPNAKLLKQMAYCYYYMKNKEKALEYLQKYLQANPNDEVVNKWIKSLMK